MRTESLNRTVVAVMVAVGLAALTASRLQADSKDTVETVMQAARNAGPGISKLLGDLRQRGATASAAARAEIDTQINTVTKLQGLVSRLGGDRALAGQFLSLSKKNDKIGLATLWSKEASGGTFQVREVKDWQFWGYFVDTAGYEYEVCLGDGCKGAPITPLGRARKSTR